MVSPHAATPSSLTTPNSTGAAILAAARSAVLSILWGHQWLRVLLLLTVAVAVRAPALQGERIWDDNFLAQDNPFIKSPLLIGETFRHYLFPDSFSAHYRPIQNISYLLDYFFWNTNTFGFHLTNVLLHAGSGVLLYFLLRQLFASLFLRRLGLAARARALQRFRWISLSAFCVAIIWVVHPVHSAAVDYISGRADSLAFIFAAGAWLAVLRAQQATGPLVCSALYFVAAASGLLALLSREIACVWVGLFLIHLIFIERHVRLRRRIFVVVCATLLVITYFALRHLPEQQPPSPLDFRQDASIRAVLMARALGDYGRLMIFPGNLHMERTVWSEESTFRGNADWRKTIATEYLSILGLIVLGCLIVASVKKGRAQSVRIFGASWFLLAYLPTSNIVQLNATVAEHWLYLPSVGFLICLFGCTLELPKKYRRILPAVAVVAVISLGVRSFVRSGDWADEETFYKRIIAAGSRSARVAMNLGQLYARRGADAEAEKMLRSVLQQNPIYPSAQTTLGAVLFHQGKVKEAETMFAEVEKNSVETRKAYPRTWFGALNHAKIRHNAKDNGAALAILEKARRDNPQVWDLVSLEAEILRQTNRIDDALQLVETFEQQNWWHEGAAVALGQLYAQKGDSHRAEVALRHASRLDVHDAKALNLIAMMRMRENRLDDACRMQRRAVSRQPDEPHQYILLSDILEKMGRGDEARAAIAHASRLRELAQPDTMLLN